MKPGYTKFNETILRAWKTKGITHVRSEVLPEEKDQEYGAERAVEITPEYADYDDVNSQSIDSDQVKEFTQKGKKKIIYIIKDENV